MPAGELLLRQDFHMRESDRKEPIMIRQQAFEKKIPMLKGGLHCHTTRSDGKVEPGDVIRLHKQNGYDFLALTDHRKYNFKNYAPETDMLIIPGMEMDRMLPNDGVGMCFHTVILGREKKDGNPFEQDQVFETGHINNAAEYQQQVLDPMYRAGQMAFYCHPEWSCTPYTSYKDMEGIFGIEVWNSGCVIEDNDDVNAPGWDDILRLGKKWYGLAVDDGHPIYQHCHGWVRVAAEKNVDSVLQALKNGEFYASCGPEIYDFYLDDDNNAVIECSEAVRVRFITGNYPTQMINAEKGAPMTSVKAPIRLSSLYVRAEVTDAEGKMAWSNPIFLHEKYSK